MRIAGITSLSAKLEVDANVFAQAREVRLHNLRALGAELGGVEGLLVGGLLGSIRVEVESVPAGCEGVVGVGGAVLGDCALEAVFADVAPRADGVGDDGDGVLGHCAGCCVESHGGYLCWSVGRFGMVICLVREWGLWYGVLCSFGVGTVGTKVNIGGREASWKSRYT